MGWPRLSLWRQMSFLLGTVVQHFAPALRHRIDSGRPSFLLGTGPQHFGEYFWGTGVQHFRVIDRRFRWGTGAQRFVVVGWGTVPQRFYVFPQRFWHSR